jgi:hypothetical protein
LIPDTPIAARTRSLHARRLVAAAIAAAMLAMPPARAAASQCGNGVVEAGEQCDSGRRSGTAACDTRCREISLEPPGLPFGPRPSAQSDDAAALEAGIYSPRLECKPFGTRSGARDGTPVHVLYRIHLCRDALGQDAHDVADVHAVMDAARVEYAKAGILLEEESLVRFEDADCDLPYDNNAWEKALRSNTPPGVLALAFVGGITSGSSLFAVGGYCYYQGPLCVMAAPYDGIVIHEMGHFLGLAHTFECAWGTETADNCEDAGDLLCDTPPDRGPWGVHGIAFCEDGTLNGSCKGMCGAKVCTDGSVPDSYDWMSYYSCEPGHFTSEQLDFMRCMLDHEMVAYNADADATTTTSSTSTTQPPPACGDVTGDGKLTAGDALGVLRAAVGLLACDDSLCDYNGSGSVSSTDALSVLQAAVGMTQNAQCPAG